MPTSFLVHDVWGSSATDVYAAGGTADGVSGVVAHYNGTNWSVVDNPVDPRRRVWGAAPNFVTAVGDPDVWVTHYDGTSWASQPAPLSSAHRIRGVWGASPTAMYAVTEQTGERLRYDGSSWTKYASALTALMDVWGADTSAVFTVG